MALNKKVADALKMGWTVPEEHFSIFHVMLDKFSLGPSSLVRLFDETKNIQCSDAVFEITKKVALASLSRVYEIEDLEPGFLEKQVRFVTRQMSSSNERQRWFYAEYTPLFITRVDFARENE